MNLKIIVVLLATLGTGRIWAQGPYPPPAGFAFSTAISANNPAISRWGQKGYLQRGWMQVTDTSLGLVSVGDTTDALGPADGQVVSLGDGGKYVFHLTTPLADHTGFDFAIFENALNDSFLELAQVEVSSDGLRFISFPSFSLSDTAMQTGSFGYTDATNIHGLAGKYRSGFGTPFDLQDVKNSSGLDIQNITHIRITDVVGCIACQQTLRDSRNIVINDPWPTPFPSSGFDLDALGIMDWGTTDIEVAENHIPTIFPNPAIDYLQIESSEKFFGDFWIVNPQGMQMASGKIENNTSLKISNWPVGCYFLKLSNSSVFKFLICD